jgi:hypothetical protein
MRASTSGFFIVIALLAAGAAQAGLLKGDPRRCAYGDPRSCASAAAYATAKRALAVHDNDYPWTGTIGCGPAHGTILRWTCRTFHEGQSMTVTVNFRLVSGAWTRQVTFGP